jgi:hypothetical protein
MSKSNRKNNETSNVETTSAPAPVETFDRVAFMEQHGNVKSRAIRALYVEGKTVNEIAKALEIKYQHVRNVLMQPLGGKLPSKDEIVVAPAPKAEVKEETEAA